MEDADAAFTRQRDRKPRLGHRVHRGGHDRDLDRDLTRQPGGGRDVIRKHAGLGRNEQHVVERQPFLPEFPVELHQALDLPRL